MAPSVTQQGRYPKRKRAQVNYDVEQSFVDVSDLEDDGYFSEELGEAVPGSPHTPANASSAHQADSITVVEIDSEYEDATFGSRKILKKRKVVRVHPPKAKRPPKFMPFRLMDLPPELRLKVYEEALVDPHGVTIRTYLDSWSESFAVHVSTGNIRRTYLIQPSCYVRGEWTAIPADDIPTKKYQLSPNLLAASKTVHAEAVSLLWEQPFIFTDVQGLHAFLLLLRPETIARLRDITLLRAGWINQKNLQAFVLLRDAPFLENFRFDCKIRPDIRLRSGIPKEQSMGEQLAKKLYSNCYPFLKELVRHRGPESILKVLKFNQEEFKNNYYDHVANAWVRDDWSKERQDKILEALRKELDIALNRKVVPRFPRSRY